jgi:hypothetical protein
MRSIWRWSFVLTGPRVMLAQEPPQGCTQNLVRAARGYTIDTSCNHPQSAMQMHGTSTLWTPSTFRGRCRRR